MLFTYTCPNCNEELEGEFTPSCPAPCCSNHDSPAFSDPGDGAEWDGPDHCSRCNKDVDIEKVIEQAEESCSTDDDFGQPDRVEDF